MWRVLRQLLIVANHERITSPAMIKKQSMFMGQESDVLTAVKTGTIGTPTPLHTLVAQMQLSDLKDDPTIGALEQQLREMDTAIASGAQSAADADNLFQEIGNVVVQRIERFRHLDQGGKRKLSKPRHSLQGGLTMNSLFSRAVEFKPAFEAVSVCFIQKILLELIVTIHQCLNFPLQGFRFDSN